MDEFRVKVTVRNNLLLSAVESAGYVGWGSQATFCADSGINASQFIALTTLKTSPLTLDGEFSKVAKALMEFFGCAPSDLWSPDQLVMQLDRNSSSFTTTAMGIQAMLSDHAEAMTLPDPAEAAETSMVQKTLASIVGQLPLRQRKVMAMRFGLDGVAEMTLEETAMSCGVTRERIRQIELQALRTLRHRKFAEALLGVGPARRSKAP